MPKLKPDTQRARREHILDAAERCFARSGFHRCTMQDICKEASVSPGALYVYFSSKEALIAGIAERDRAKLAGQLAELARAPDLLAALARLGEHYAIEEPHHKSVLGIEIGCEATRNPTVGEIFRSVDSFCLKSFEQLFTRARGEQKIAPALDTPTIAEIIAVIGDGLFWRRAVDPNFDAKKLIPAITDLVSTLLNPVRPETNAGTPHRARKVRAKIDA
jgi:AcrR family transcriptional regulator